MNHRKMHVAVTAGLVAALTVGSTPMPVLAATEQPSAQAQQAADATAAAAGTEDQEAQPQARSTEGDTAEAAPEAEEAEELTVESVVNPDAVDVPAGAASLPQTVTVRMSDGSAQERAVQWGVEGADQDDPEALPEGSYVLTGVVEGTDQTASLSLTVSKPVDQADADAAEPSDTIVDNDSSLEGEKDEGAGAEAAEAQGVDTQSVAGETARAAGQASVVVDGQTWTYDKMSTVTPVGVNPNSRPELNGAISLTCAETGEPATVYLNGVWDLSQMPTEGDGYPTQAGTYTVTQTYGNYGSRFDGVTFEADVEVKEVQAIPSLSVTQYVGATNLGLGYSTEIVLDDGSTCQTSINWNQEEFDAATAGLATPGDYEVTGTLYMSNITVTATVRVLEIREAYSVSLYTTPGTAPSLPSSVTVELSSGETRTVSVTWDPIDPSQYAETGYFDTMGTVDNSNVRVRAEVRVSDIVSIGEANSTIAVGGRLPWHPSVTVTYELGTTSVFPDWEEPPADDPRWSQAGTFDIYGAIPGTDEKAVLHVTVIDPQSYDREVDYKVTQGRSTLPGSVSVEKPDGTTSMLDVDWTWPDSSLFDRVGTFDVEGVISGTDLPVTLHVTVVGIESVGEVSAVTTTEGVLPQLPYSVPVTYTDGTTGDEQVDWDLVSLDDVKADNSPLTVHGVTHYGGFKSVSVQVNVLWTQPARETLPVSTLAGVAPQLPSSYSMVMSDGTERYMNVQWETPDPTAYATAGRSFKVNGYVAGSDYPLTAEVSVYNAVDGTEKELSTAVGIAPRLESSTSITLENGDTLYISNRVLWDAVDESAYAQAGSFDVNGSIMGTSTQMVTHVTVSELAALRGLDDSIEYLIGSGTTNPSYVLPSTAAGYLDDGAYVSVPVEWTDVNDAFLTTPGTYTARATVNGEPFTMTIHSYKIVSDVTATESVSFLAGVAPTYLYGDCTAEVDDGSGQTATKTFEYNAYELSFDDADLTAGDHQVTVPAYVQGPRGSVETSVNVTLHAYPSVIRQEEVNVWTLPGNAPSLPQMVEVTPGDANPVAAIADFLGSLVGARDADEPETLRVNVTWDDVDPAQYADDKDGSTFTVKGTINGTDIGVTATVEVASIASIAIPQVTTAPGVAPQLPDWVTVTTSTGSQHNVYFSPSESIPGSAYQEAGASFTVEGTLEIRGGASQQVVIPVTVVAPSGVVEGDDLNNLLSLTTDVGTMPQLPSSVPVALDNGAVIPLDVTWEPLSYQQFQQVGTVTATGQVEDLASQPAEVARALAASNGEVTATISVVEPSDEPALSYVVPQYAFIAQGDANDFSEDGADGTSVSVRLSDGTYQAVNVTWNTDEVDFNTPGTYAMHGTVDGYDKQAVMYVTVTAASQLAQSVEPFTYTVKVSDADRDQIALALPQQIVVTYSDGTRGLADVLWDLSGLTDKALSEPGEIAITGTVTGTDLTAKATIKIVADDSDEAYATGVEDLALISTYETIAPELPAQVALTMSDGTTKNVDVVWNGLSANDWAEGKAGTSFTVTGVTVEGGFTVTATINVLDLVHAESISIAGEGVEDGKATVEKGDKLALSAAVSPADAYYQDITWSSSNEEVATVDSDGVVTALRGGEATITASNAEGVEASITVTVPRSAESLTVTSGKTTYTLGEAFDASSLKVQVAYDDGSAEDVAADAYTVSAPDMTTAGEKTVTVSWNEQPEITGTLTITVVDPNEPSGNPVNKPGSKPGAGATGNEVGPTTGQGGSGAAGGSAAQGADAQGQGSTSQKQGLPTTADTGMLASVTAGGAGIAALFGAWVARRRARRAEREE